MNLNLAREKIELHTVADEEYYNQAGRLLEVVSRASEIFRSSETEEKHEFMKFLFLNLTLNGEILEFTLRKPFDTIFEHVTRQQWCPRRDLNPYGCPYAPQTYASAIPPLGLFYTGTSFTYLSTIPHAHALRNKQ